MWESVQSFTLSLSANKTLTEKPTDAWHARMTISLWSLWMIIPPTCPSRPNNNNNNNHHNISHTTRGKLSGGNTSYTYIEHCHVLDYCAPITSRVYTCSCWSITYKYDSSPHTTTYMYLPYLTYLIITSYICMKFPLPPRNRGLDGKTKKPAAECSTHQSGPGPGPFTQDRYLSTYIPTVR